MIFEAELRELNTSSNPKKCKVRIPALEPAGNDPILLNAYLSILPGFTFDYAIGDTVYVTFLENDYSKPIILGKRLQNINIENKNAATNNSSFSVNSLNVKANAEIKNLTVTNAFSMQNAALENFRTTLFGNSGFNATEALPAIQMTKNFQLAKKLSEDTTAKITTFNKIEIGTFEQANDKDIRPRKYRQEFKIIFSEPMTFPYTLQIPFPTNMPKSLIMAKIDLVNTFLLTDQYTLNPGIYLYDETGKLLTTQQIFEVKTDLKNRKFTVCISGKTGTEQFKSLYLTTEYAASAE